MLEIWRRKKEKYEKINRKFLRASRHLYILANKLLQIENISNTLLELARSLEYKTIELQELHEEYNTAKRKLLITRKKEDKKNPSRKYEKNSSAHRDQIQKYP